MFHALKTTIFANSSNFLNLFNVNLRLTLKLRRDFGLQYRISAKNHNKILKQTTKKKLCDENFISMLIYNNKLRKNCNLIVNS